MEILRADDAPPPNAKVALPLQGPNRPSYHRRRVVDYERLAQRETREAREDQRLAAAQLEFRPIRIMRPLRTIHVAAGVLAFVLAALMGSGIVLALVLSPLQNAECSRIETSASDLKHQLETYRRAHGSYPDSLPGVALADSFRNRVVYQHTASSYEVSVKGRWHEYMLSVSNNGACSSSTLQPR